MKHTSTLTLMPNSKSKRPMQKTWIIKKRNAITTASLVLLLVLIAGCTSRLDQRTSDSGDLEKIKALHENYRTFWLENDSSKVVNLFSEKGGLIPPNNSTDFILGKKDIGAWWFSVVDKTTYPLTGVVYLRDTLLLVDSKTAVWEGISKVSWDTMIGDSLVSSSESSSNFITICIKEGDEWRIFRQIWNVRPAPN
jgi:hypothetical protein